MRIDKVYIEQFKNLDNFYIDLEQENMNTVLLGQNAAGKSNFLEALVIIFRDLDLGVQTSFNYVIEYRCKGNLIRVNGGPGIRNVFGMFLGKKKGDKIEYDTIVSKAAVSKNKNQYLPKYVFAYYSGVSDRLLEHFDPHQRRFYKDLLDGVDDPMRPLFYARLIHSHFVLMAFYAFGHEKVNEFLEEYLDITGLESVLFVMKKPVWSKKKSDQPTDFWGAKGVVRGFLDDLWEYAMAPITNQEMVREDFRRSHKQEQLYLYVSNQEKLEKLAEKYGSNTEFFKSLESTYISDLIQEVRVKVKKRNVHGDITFKELSEGEQQLLTVLGLLRFTKEEESLILLDEPDTHLNPLWKWKYMNLLEEVVQKPETSQIIMTTHDPLVIGGLTKEEIRIFYSEKETNEEGKEVLRIKTQQPDFDPKGLGVAGILTSEFFNLPSTLDQDTLDDLIRRNQLMAKQESQGLSDEEKQDLTTLFHKLSALGINTTDRDPFYQKFLIALSEREDFSITPLTPEEREEQNKIASEILEEILKEEQK